MRLLLLDCDFDQDERSTARMIVRDLIPVGASIDIYRVFEEQFPEEMTGYDAVIVNGSAANVVDGEAWMLRLFSLIKGMHEQGIPLLGICFGHQAIALALGGEVIKLDKTEFGYVPLQLEQHPLFSGFDAQGRLFQYHSYAVSTLPRGATPLARNDTCVQAFKLGSTYGIQFHPEILPEAAEGIAFRNGKDLAALEAEIPHRETRPELLFKNFVTLIQRESNNT